MTGKGSLSSAPQFRLRLMIAIHLVWMTIVCLLGAWWGRLGLRQASRIAELEKALGWSTDLTQSQWHRTQRMLFWESGSFFALLVACTLLLLWIYWRDVKRARSIQAFFASVTHELRTPLASIRLQAESIAEELSVQNDSQKKLIRRLLEDSLRLEAQVERTLELARVEGGGPVYTQTLQIKPWLDRFLKTWQSDHLEGVQCDPQVEDVLIEADPSAMNVIFKNLLENSLRHSKKNQVKITISSEVRNQKVALVLRDNGQGYMGEAKLLGKLFQKGPGSHGTGVGLYLVKVLMKRMGGWVQFSLQNGFEVSLWFPEGKTHG